MPVGPLKARPKSDKGKRRGSAGAGSRLGREEGMLGPHRLGFGGFQDRRMAVDRTDRPVQTWQPATPVAPVGQPPSFASTAIALGAAAVGDTPRSTSTRASASTSIVAIAPLSGPGECRPASSNRPSPRFFHTLAHA